MSEQDHTWIAVSAQMDELEGQISAAARSDAKVLITGESGVGKELAARALHAQSVRAAAPLVVINCAGLPETLLESELFGHERGSFTGAYRDKPGLLESAHGGTVFLDEIGEMTLRMQALLLRFVERGEIQRVGSDRHEARVDVRLVCATNRDLREQIAAGTFREDLFYRLNVIHLIIPPLRERPDDVRPLAEHYCELFARRHRHGPLMLSPESLAVLHSYDWPGNVRELRNVIERAVIRAKGSSVTPADLPVEVRGAVVANLTAESVEAPSAPTESANATSGQTVASALYRLMVVGGESFWSVVYEPFMARDLTRDTVRQVIGLGLEATQGRYSQLVDRFNMPSDDYKRLLSFLRKYDCLVPFQPYRRARATPGVEETVTPPRVA